MKKGMGGHQTTEGQTDTWFTPPEIIRSLGEFDLDPCAHVDRPWDTAKKHLTIEDNSLNHEWEGRVWLNPPYNRYLIEAFLKRMSDHMNGIALIFARTETKPFQDWVFPFAESILFIKSRLHFHNIDGVRAKANSGAPSVLISYSEYDSYMIEQSGIKGAHIPINNFPVIVVEQSPSWQKVVAICLVRLNGKATLSDIYKTASVVAGDKVEKNRHYREKIRQTLQRHFEKVDRGVYKN